jgi:hypothetical protein
MSDETLGGFVVRTTLSEIKTIKVTNDHPAFARTPYASKAWWIEIRFISAAKLEDTLHATRVTKRGEPSLSEAYSKLFVEHVLEWNLLGEDSKVLPCTPEMKRMVASQFFNLVHRVVNIAANKDIELLEAEEESGKG